MYIIIYIHTFQIAATSAALIGGFVANQPSIHMWLNLHVCQLHTCFFDKIPTCSRRRFRFTFSFWLLILVSCVEFRILVLQSTVAMLFKD